VVSRITQYLTLIHYRRNHYTFQVTLASATCASSCVPMLIEPVPLLEKDPATGELRPYEAHSPASATSSSTNSSSSSSSSSSGGGGSAGAGAGAGAVTGAGAGGIEFEVPLEHIRMRDGTFESDVPVQAIAELFNCHFCVVSQVNPHIIVSTAVLFQCSCVADTGAYHHSRTIKIHGRIDAPRSK
jgi:predicted acylesterase/phospholipase RssA